MKRGYLLPYFFVVMSEQPDIIQPPPLDVQTIHKSVIDIFPELDLTQILTQHGNLDSDTLASAILDSIENIPKKRVQERGQKRKASEINPVNKNHGQKMATAATCATRPPNLKKALLDNENVELVGQEFIQFKGLNKNSVKLYMCKLCDIFELSGKSKDAHLKGRRHRDNYKRIQTQKRIECLVCFDLVPSSHTVLCNALSQSSHEGNFNKPGPSSAIYKEFQQINDQKEKENSDPRVHAFCRMCVRGSASAAVGEVPMAKGGIGLRCMVPDCENPILYSEIRTLLKSDVRKKLDERIVEENLGMASLTNLERCTKCNFAIEMEVDKNINKVFDCLGCGYKICRLCERAWDDDHFGITCKELDEKQDIKDKKEREIEKQMNDAIVRKCPSCGIQFVKKGGCNKMTCRCGMKQCYICRESNITYEHFCQHFRDPNKIATDCDQCDKKCLLHENSNKKDEQLIKEILKK